jgi:hypothetical protein
VKAAKKDWKTKMDTKACSLTENEIKQLIIWHGYNLNDEGKNGLNIEDMSERIERINYLNKRLKTFKEIDKPEDQPKAQMSPEETKATTLW